MHAEGVTALDVLDERRHRMGLLRRMRAVLADGAHTTVHVSAYDPALTRLRIERLARPEPLHTWCARNRVGHAMGGGFFVRADGVPLGELRAGGARCHSVPFELPWSRVRACVSAHADTVVLARRDELEREPPGDLLQAGRCSSATAAPASTAIPKASQPPAISSTPTSPSAATRAPRSASAPIAS